MNNTLEILELLENTNSRIEKENILKNNVENEILKKIFLYALDPFKIYGIGKKSIKELININIKSNFETIFDLCEYLLIHNTGNESDKNKVNIFLSNQDELHKKWFSRILLKDLRIMLTEKTINKIFSNLVPTFTVQLAEPFEKFYNNVACEVKIDGCRCLSIKQNGIVKMFTRNGKQIEGFNDVAENIKKLPIDNIVFDGEIIGKNYTDTMNQLFAKGNNKQGTYMIFDMLTPDEFYDGESSFDYWTRKQGLINLRKSLNIKEFSSLHFVEPLAILDNPTIEQFNELMNKVVNDGFEGIMIKPLNSKYKAKRSYDWQKLKLFMSDEFNIIGFETGEGKYKNTLGKVIIDVDGTQVGVGSGFSDSQRDEIWLNQNQYLGKQIEVQYQEKIAKTGALRFPTVKSIRLDK